MTTKEKLRYYRACGKEITMLTAQGNHDPSTAGCSQRHSLLANARRRQAVFKADLHPLFEQLPPGRCQVVNQLYFTQGYTAQEVADALDITPRCVYMHIRRMRQLASSWPESGKEAPWADHEK